MMHLISSSDASELACPSVRAKKLGRLGRTVGRYPLKGDSCPSYLDERGRDATSDLTSELGA